MDQVFSYFHNQEKLHQLDVIFFSIGEDDLSLTPDSNGDVPTLSLLARVVQGGLPVVEATVTVRVDR